MSLSNWKAQNCFMLKTALGGGSMQGLGGVAKKGEKYYLGPLPVKDCLISIIYFAPILVSQHVKWF